MDSRELMRRLADILDECGVLAGEIKAAGSDQPGHREQQEYGEASLAALADQCSELIGDSSVEPEPIRMIHHFACTGGTLISKCVSAMPNVQLLSEVAPYSQMQSSSEIRFSPTDMIRLLRSSSRGSSAVLELQLFNQAVSLIYDDCMSKGERLVLREHCHSKYCVGERVQDGPPLKAILSSHFGTRSIVTVRHPLDSFMSLSVQGWLTFSPNTMDEYARRYDAFLRDHHGLPLYRYEDFVQDPNEMMAAICRDLEIAYAAGFTETFQVNQLSGNSGRSSGKISTRSRRPVPPEILAQLDSSAYRGLCARLGYSPGAND